MFKSNFDSFACVNDSIKCEVNGITYTATLHQDTDANPEVDYDCYSGTAISRWKNDKWFYVGVVLSAENAEGWIKDNLASLWSVECNFNKAGNKYLKTVANELLAEHLA